MADISCKDCGSGRFSCDYCGGDPVVVDEGVTLDQGEWDLLYGTFEKLMSVNSDDNAIVEAIKAENAVWALLKVVKQRTADASGPHPSPEVPPTS